MRGLSRVELSRMLATPLVTIGTLGAILVWEFENVGSEAAAALIASCAIGAAVVVAAGLRERILKVSQHYEALLATADEQSRRAESASRVKDEFLATLSHELRTPLNSVLGWARLLATGKLNEAQTAQAIAAIERAGWAQSNLIENLLDASRMVEGKLHVAPRPAMVQPIVEGAVDAIRPSAEFKRIALEVRLDPTIGAVSVDANRLHQIVWHLVSNAVKFTPVGGRVDRVRRIRRRRDAAGGPRYRRRLSTGNRTAPVRAVPAGRDRHDAAVRRAGARPRHRASSGGAARRHDRRAKRRSQRRGGVRGAPAHSRRRRPSRRSHAARRAGAASARPVDSRRRRQPGRSRVRAHQPRTLWGRGADRGVRA